MDINRVFRKWLKRIPLPLQAQDREAGYDWALSIWQMEVGLTQIFDRPLRGAKPLPHKLSAFWLTSPPSWTCGKWPVLRESGPLKAGRSARHFVQGPSSGPFRVRVSEPPPRASVWLTGARFAEGRQS
jgi:hypothetical protein